MWRSTRRRHIPHAAPVALCHGRAVHAERTHATSPAGTARSACEGGRRRAIHRQCQRDRAVAESASRSWVLRDRSGYGRASMGVIGAAVFCLGLSLVGSGSPQKTCLRGSGVRHRLDKALFLSSPRRGYIHLIRTDSRFNLTQGGCNSANATPAFT